ncbi:hypothetical protein [Nocardia farcinica]
MVTSERRIEINQLTDSVAECGNVTAVDFHRWRRATESARTDGVVHRQHGVAYVLPGNLRAPIAPEGCAEILECGIETVTLLIVESAADGVHTLGVPCTESDVDATPFPFSHRVE